MLVITGCRKLRNTTSEVASNNTALVSRILKMSHVVQTLTLHDKPTQRKRRDVVAM